MEERSEIRHGTDGWRAVVAEGFTLNNVIRVARSLAEYLLRNDPSPAGIAVSYDSRFLSDRFAEHLSREIGRYKIPVFLSDRITPTPALSYFVKHKGLSAGVMITASHNPPHYNGIKIKGPHGGPFSGDKNPHVFDFIDKSRKPFLDPKRATKMIDIVDMISPYANHLCRFINCDLISDPPFKVVADAMFGAGCGIFSAVLPQIPVTCLHNVPNMTLSDGSPEPIPRNLSLLQKTVVETKARIGFALDGDADRFAIIDEKGRFVQLHDLLPLLFHYLAIDRGQPGDVVRNMAMADTVDRMAVKFNRKVTEVPVGFANICREMMENEILIGAEESGGFGYAGHIPERDGVLSCLLCLEMMIKQNKSMADLVNDLCAEYGPFFYKRIDQPIDAKTVAPQFRQFCKNPPEHLGKYRIVRTDQRNGIKLYTESGNWILIRFSKTEPLLRLYSGGPEDETVTDLINEIIPKLGIKTV